MRETMTQTMTQTMTKTKTMNEDYSDIIDLEHVTVPGHPRMSMAQRAAQFAPFAALVSPNSEEKEEK